MFKTQDISAEKAVVKVLTICTGGDWYSVNVVLVYMVLRGPGNGSPFPNKESSN